jgi:hypothetical protein
MELGLQRQHVCGKNFSGKRVQDQAQVSRLGDLGGGGSRCRLAARK